MLGGTNLYAYVGNDPVNWVDPLGLTAIYIFVKRMEFLEDCTIGNLSIYSEPLGYASLGYTLEPPWRNNEQFVSSIPTGTYAAERYNSPKYGRVPRLKNVPNRYDILMHYGNYPSNTEGCILVGKQKGNNSVLDSKKALREMMNYIDAVMSADKLAGEQTSIEVSIFHDDL